MDEVSGFHSPASCLKDGGVTPKGRYFVARRSIVVVTRNDSRWTDPWLAGSYLQCVTRTHSSRGRDAVRLLPLLLWRRCPGNCARRQSRLTFACWRIFLLHPSFLATLFPAPCIGVDENTSSRWRMKLEDYKPVPLAPFLSLVFRPLGGHKFSISLPHKPMKIWVRADAAAQLTD